jgi:hypothetical protein
MSASFAILFALLVAVPGLLIPLYIISLTRHTLADVRRDDTDKRIAWVTIVAMLILIAFSTYAALAIYNSLSAIASR